MSSVNATLQWRRAPPHRILLEGPPGTDKTMTTAVLAHELDLPLLTIRLDALLSKYLGETASKLRVLFDPAASQRAVYLFDEFDALGGDRAGNDVGEARRILNSFLLFLESAGPQSIVVAPTNHKSILDRALFRRFDLGGGNPKVRPVERRAHGERVKSEADTALATQDARRESLVELESLGVVITIEGATGFPLKLDSLEQRTTHTQPRLADRCRPAPAPTQRKAAGQAFRVVRSDQETLPIGEGDLDGLQAPDVPHPSLGGATDTPRRTTRGSVGVRQQRCATARSSCSAIRARMRVVPRSGSRSP